MGTRLDISINEKGLQSAIREINDVAATLQRISPRMARSVRGRALRVGINAEKALKRAGQAVAQAVVKFTPVDTGQARANWRAFIQQPLPQFAPQLGKTDRNGSATIEEMKSLIGSSRLKPGQTIWISNVLPYIEKLENGYSLQAPGGMTTMAIQAGMKELRNAKVL